MIVVGAAIIDNGELLACRRISPPELAGLFEFPGGKVELGEMPAAALVREIREELGVEIICDAEPLGIWPMPGERELWVFRASLLGGRPISSTDHDQLVWLAPGEWQECAWIDVDREAVDRLEGDSYRK